MSIDDIKNNLPAYAKDIKLNLETVMVETGSPDLTQQQIYIIALAAASACKHPAIISALLEEIAEQLSPVEIDAAKAAASIMGMNNVYYRFLHLVNDDAFAKLPARLRMNVIANPGISKIDFELSCLAVSAINGCGMCIESHTHELIKAGVTRTAIQSAVRLAAVFHAVSMSWGA